jgi:uncharacterized protein (TIGR03067 family)
MRHAVVALLALLAAPVALWRTAQADDPKKEKEELAALQGRWTPTSYEEGGKVTDLKERKREWVFRGDEHEYLENGKVVGKGKIKLNVTASPKHLDISYEGGQKDFTIYTLNGNVLTTCGSRRQGGDPTRPREFASGTPKGGDYLIVWKREK